jgi:hypothetical protein
MLSPPIHDTLQDQLAASRSTTSITLYFEFAVKSPFQRPQKRETISTSLHKRNFNSCISTESYEFGLCGKTINHMIIPQTKLLNSR